MLWNAESRGSEITKHDLYAVIYFKAKTIKFVHRLTRIQVGNPADEAVPRETESTPSITHTEEMPRRNSQKIKIQVISSCSVGSGRTPIDFLSSVRTKLAADPVGLNILEDGRLRIEYYMAMLDDIGFDKHPSYKNCSLSKALAVCRKSVERIDLLWAKRTALEAKEKKLLITGFSSFIPEISSFDQQTRSDSVEAMLAIHEIAMVFNLNGHRITYLELVGGSILGSLAQFDDQERTMCLNVLSAVDSLDYLYESLRAIEESVSQNRAEKPGFPQLKLLLEIEPGLEFVLNRPAEMLSLLNKLSDNVGINIDIPHYRLAINENEIDETVKFIRDFRSRIGNVHLSRHSKSHFCDLCFDEKNVESVDEQLINAIFSEPSCQPSVTVEYEAAPSARDVCNSLCSTYLYLNERF